MKQKEIERRIMEVLETGVFGVIYMNTPWRVSKPSSDEFKVEIHSRHSMVDSIPHVGNIWVTWEDTEKKSGMRTMLSYSMSKVGRNLVLKVGMKQIRYHFLGVDMMYNFVVKGEWEWNAWVKGARK